MHVTYLLQLKERSFSGSIGTKTVYQLFSPHPANISGSSGSIMIRETGPATT